MNSGKDWLFVFLFSELHLSRGGYPFNDGEADDNPGHQQGQGHFHIQPAALRYSAGRVQSLTVPEVGRSRAFLALRLYDLNQRKKLELHLFDQKDTQKNEGWS